MIIEQIEFIEALVKKLNNEVVLNFESVENVNVKRAYRIHSSDLLLTAAMTIDDDFGLLSVATNGRVCFESLNKNPDIVQKTQMDLFGIDFPQARQA